ncbi:hypothetical protein HPB50_016634 [Hyalomma asiaticum]|uniref:Uncharacterized protein n=1 Tax=Hyalomma asiaticum TaxID=266040 RepID=A0ACB7SZE4_HYAAI|nr:hypothetical protein HPB50_016634 [Hyalomma asiaticum]
MCAQISAHHMTSQLSDARRASDAVEPTARPAHGVRTTAFAYYRSIPLLNICRRVDCLKLAFSKCLGYGIIVGSTLVKVPQIVKIVQTQSGEGISVTSVLMELIGMTATAAYSYAQRYPFRCQYAAKCAVEPSNDVLAQLHKRKSTTSSYRVLSLGCRRKDSLP